MDDEPSVTAEPQEVTGFPGRYYRAVRAFAERVERIPYFAGICVLGVVTTPVVLGQLDKVLKAMQPPGGASYGVESLSPIPGFGSTPSTHDVVTTWNVWHLIQQPAAPRDSSWILGWYLGIDAVVFITLYSCLFLILLVRARKHLLARTGDQPTGDNAVYLRWIAYGLMAVPVLALTDLLEDIVQGLLGGGVWHATWGRDLASSLTGLKFALLVAILVVIAFAWIGVGWEQRATLGAWFGDLRLYRFSVLLVVVFGLFLLGPSTVSDQSLDVLRRMADQEQLGLIVIPILLVALFTAVLGASCRAVIPLQRARVAPDPTPDAGLPGTLVIWFFDLAIIGGVFLVLGLKTDWFPVGLAIPFLIAAVVALLSRFALGASSPAPDKPTRPTFVSRLIPALPLVIFGLAAVKASVGDVFYSGRWPLIVLFLAIGLPCIAIGALVSASLHRLDSKRTDPDRPEADEKWWTTKPENNTPEHKKLLLSWGVLALGAVVSLFFWIVTLVDPWDAANWSDGAIGVTLEALTAFALLGLGLTLIAEKVQVPPVFALLRFRRIPVLMLLLAWLLVASAIDTVGNHQVRAVPEHPVGKQDVSVNADRRANAPRAYTLDAAFKNWLKSDEPVLSSRGQPKTKPRARPMVFVTAVGGGIKAAYWTSLVLDCLVYDGSGCTGKDRVDPRSIFAVSGASGGSLGLVEYVTAHDHSTDAGTNWVQSKLGGEFLGPTFAWMLFADVPNALVRTRVLDDRAAILERSWERAWPTAGSDLQEGLYQRGKRFPILLMNGTSVTDGCRFETSVLAAAAGDPVLQPNKLRTPGRGCLSPVPFDAKTPKGLSQELKQLGLNDPYVPPARRTEWALSATKDLADYLCRGQDIRLSTAALLSARFPIVSPSGKLSCSNNKYGPTYVVDGGYFDNTATSTIEELWAKLRLRVAWHNRSTMQSKTNPTCIVPYLIEIDNHYGPPSPPPSARPDELMVPTTTLGKLMDSHQANAALGAAIQFSRGNRFAIIYPRSHPGTEAPLGWTMSDIAQSDLKSQLQNAYVQKELEVARSFFDSKRASCTDVPK
jgi:hypothetical protein